MADKAAHISDGYNAAIPRLAMRNGSLKPTQKRGKVYRLNHAKGSRAADTKLPKVSYPRAVNHIALRVDDLDKAINWYKELFGFVLLRGPFETSLDTPCDGEMAVNVIGPGFRNMWQACLVSINGIGVELFQLTDPAYKPPRGVKRSGSSGFSHLSITDPNVEETVARITQNGGRQISSVRRIAPQPRSYRKCYCEDPFGNIIEIYSHTYEQIYGGIEV